MTRDCSNQKVLGTIVRGDTINIQLVFVNDDDTPEDITGWEIWSTLKANLTDADGSAEFQVTQVVPAGAEATAGEYTLSIPSTDTASVDEGTYWFDIQRVIPGAPPDVLTVVREEVDVVLDVTQATA